MVEALRNLPVRGADLMQVQRWVMFDYLIGNAGAHGKNLSVLVKDKGYRLAPFYDLLCVKAYGDDGLALFIGDEETFTAVGAHSWKALCKDCGFGLPETLEGFRKMAQDYLAAWRKEPDRTVLDNQTTAAEAAVVERITQVFQAHTANALFMSEGMA